MLPLTDIRLFATLGLTCALIACGDGNDPTAPAEVTPVATTLRIANGTVTVLVPQSTSVTAVVHDQMGRAMSSLPPTWTSRDSTTATVTSEGLVTAVETGDTWVVAAAAELMDSVLVQVRFPVGTGEARARIRRRGADRSVLMSPGGRSYDLVGTDTLDRIQLEFDGTDAYLLVVAPAPMATGDVAVRAWSVDEILESTVLQVPAPGAMFFERTGDDGVLYVGDSGSLQVTGSTSASAPGESGTLTGHLRLRAVGYVLGNADPDNPEFVVTGDTATLDLDFDVSFVHREVGYAKVDFHGGPVEAAQEIWEATIGWPNVTPPDTPLIELKVHGAGELTAVILSPHPGPLTIYPQNPDGMPTVGNDYTTLWMTSHYPYFRASGQGGTVTLGKVLWPQATASGELSGTMDASLIYWLENNPANAQTGTVTMEFHALWLPKQTGQAAPGLLDGKSPWGPLFVLPGR